MRARDFFVAMPKLCGARNAARWSDVIGFIYDSEMAGGTPFDRSAEDIADPDNRFEVAFAWEADDENAKDQCKRLARMLMWSHYCDEHGERQYAPMVDQEYHEAKTVEYLFPDIMALMTADEAVLGHWED